MTLPLFKDMSQTFQLLQTKWSALLNPVLAQPIISSLILPSITLTSGVNTINHLLGRKLQGYLVILNNSNATFYDSQDVNPMPELTLILNASANAKISLMVF